MSRQLSADWRHLRRRVLVRDQARCRHCSAREPDVTLHAHHIVPVERGGKDEITNIVTLCEFCHYETHGHINTHKEITETDLPSEPSETFMNNLCRVEELTSDLEEKERELESVREEKERELESVREEKRRISDRLDKIDDAMADSGPPLILHESEGATGPRVDDRTRAFDEAGVLKRLKWRITGMPADDEPR